MAETNDIIYLPREEHLPRECKNCLIISYDLETTGLSSEDEIIQIGAYTCIPSSRQTSEFSQFILPATRIIHPEAAAKTGLEVRTGQLYDSRRNMNLPTVSELEGLHLFLKWVTSLRDGYDGVVLISHGAIFLDIPLLMKALKRTCMSHNFLQVVKGFCDSNAIFQEDRSKRYGSLSLQSLYQKIVGTRGEAHRAAEDARDLYTLLLRHFNVESLSLAIPMLDSYTYTFRCMELYTAWKLYVDGKMDSLRVVVRDCKAKSEKRKTAILKNLVAASYDIQTLFDNYKSTSERSFRIQLRDRIQSMKNEHENYLLDTRCVRTEEVVSTVVHFLKQNRMHSS